MLWRIAFLCLIAGWTASGLPSRHGQHVAEAIGGVVVTSTGDAGGAALCPSESACTLRAAIEAANADASGGTFTISFDTEVFPASTPATVSIGLTPLPPLSRDGAIVDASGAGVLLRYDNPSLSGSTSGLIIAADDASIWGLDISGFPAACLLVEGDRITVGGDRTLGRGNRFAECSTGIAEIGRAHV